MTNRARPLLIGPQGSQGAQGYAGSQGAQGPVGTQGTQGPQGYTGATGSQGTQGPQGFTGAQGNQGPQGLTGSQGTQGPQGYTGAQGSQGPQGYTGAQGTQGTQGPRGFQGNTGAQGYTGSQGPQGYTGVTGSQGTQGPQGYTGATGSQGTQGPQGLRGYQGFQGATGSTGTQGPQGYTGSTGTQGTQGPQGAQGTQGSSASNHATLSNLGYTASGHTGFAALNGSTNQYFQASQIDYPNGTGTNHWITKGNTGGTFEFLYYISPDYSQKAYIDLSGNLAATAFVLPNSCNLNSNSSILRLVNGSYTISLFNTGNVEIGGDLTLLSTKNVYAGNFVLNSDIKLKENIKPLNAGSNKNIEFVEFNMINDNEKRFGVVAQQVEKILPQLIRTDKDGMKSVAYIDLLIYKIAELEKRIKYLENAKCS